MRPHTTFSSSLMLKRIFLFASMAMLHLLASAVALVAKLRPAVATFLGENARTRTLTRGYSRSAEFTGLSKSGTYTLEGQAGWIVKEVIYGLAILYVGV
jgi:hypothetical protein